MHLTKTVSSPQASTNFTDTGACWGDRRLYRCQSWPGSTCLGSERFSKSKEYRMVGPDDSYTIFTLKLQTDISSREYSALIVAEISFFFLRASIMLFTLRLLAAHRKWLRSIIHAALIINIAITMIAVVSFGVKCTPFTAIYQDTNGAKCVGSDSFVAIQIAIGSE